MKQYIHMWLISQQDALYIYTHVDMSETSASLISTYYCYYTPQNGYLEGIPQTNSSHSNHQSKAMLNPMVFTGSPRGHSNREVSLISGLTMVYGRYNYS